MTISRRGWLKNIVLGSAGAILLPACLHQEVRSGIVLKNIQIDPAQENLLAALAEVIIPSGSTLGAKELDAHAFALHMVDDLFSPSEQQKFMRGLQQFQERIAVKLHVPYDQDDKTAIGSYVKTVEQSKGKADSLSFFYFGYKQQVIRAYTYSEYFLTKVQPYELVPGRYHGCVPLTDLQKSSIKKS